MLEDTAVQAPPPRRARRRTETVDEILRVAVDVMREEGAAALSLSEVARRVGVRYDEGRFTRLVPLLIGMFVRTYAPEGNRP